VAADIHGSEVCWRKFLNAGSFYGADVLVLGGDITGKALVPLVAEGRGRFRLVFMGRERVVEGDELDDVERLIRFNGFYPYRCEPEEADLLSRDPGAVQRAFGSSMREQVRGWVALADARLRGGTSVCLAMPGNDDEDFVAEILGEGEELRNHDGRVVEVGDHRIVGYGWSNPTPWRTPREKPEPEIERDLRALTRSAGDPDTLILNPHVPPYDSGLDLAPQLGPGLTMATRGGQPVYEPVGSRAVRTVVEEVQPLLVLSGHIHESRGVSRLGRSVCVNPGSEYNVGRLLGAIVDIAGKEVRGVQLVVG
jgi:Icc-related predicted phosphoesterase